MRRWAQLMAAGVRVIFSTIGSLLLWAVWLGLVLLLFAQLYIANTSELALPEVVLRQLEARLAESGLRATFSRTSFDPTGRILIENVRLSAPAFRDPLVTARAVYVRLNPWPLVVGRIDPREIRVTGATASIPTLLSPNGQPEEMIRNLEINLEPVHKAIAIRQLNAEVAGIVVNARGTIALPRRTPARPFHETMAEFLTQQFPGLCRDALAWRERLAAVENPVLDLDFVPSDSGAVAIQITALTTRAKTEAPLACEATQIRATTRVLLFGDSPASRIDLTAREVRLPGDVVVKGAGASVYGRIRPGETEFDLREVSLTADAVSGGGFAVETMSALVHPRPLPRLTATIVASVYAAPLGVHGEIDLQEGSAQVRFAGGISPAILDPLSEKLKVNVRKFYDFEAMTADRGDVRLGPGWKFEKLTARVRIPRMNSYGVIMEDGRATVELEPHRFYSPDAFARIGENFARGTYEHDLRTHQFRFLLQGRLRPLEISHWFRDWWPNFFRTLEFHANPPEASVDVAGIWREGWRTTVFVFADAGHSTIRGAEFDRARTRLFIRPGFFDGLEVMATRGEGQARGRFTFELNPESGLWRSFELGLDSTLDLKVAAPLMPPAALRALEPFKIAGRPALKVRGSFSGPGAHAKTPDKLRIEARTTGEFRYHDFPLRDVSFTATLEGDEVLLEDVEAMFAGGVTGGRARVSGQGTQRRLGFDFALKDATLGQAVGTLQAFFAARKGEPPPAPGKYIQEKANVRLDLSASAEGSYTDPLSFKGNGNATLSGGEIGEVPLLGQLSELLKFTALRFTSARTNFKIDGPKLIFPQLELRGSDSAIDAHGEFNLTGKTLDFNAKIFPFQESGNLLKTVVGAVLAPLSNAFEVKLSGTLTKPEWVFVIGPTNFLRSLTSEAENPAKASDSPQAADTKTPPADSGPNNTPERQP